MYYTIRINIKFSTKYNFLEIRSKKVIANI